MTLLTTIIYWTAVTSTGYQLLKFFKTNISRSESIGLSILIGTGVHTLVYFILTDHVGMGYFNSTYLLLGEFVVATLISRQRTLAINAPLAKIEWRLNIRSSMIALGLIIGATTLSYTWLQSMYWPVYEPDAIHLYDYRSKRAMIDQSYSLADPIVYQHSELYPPYTSLLHIFQYQLGLENPKSIYALIYTAWYLVVMGYLTRNSGSHLLGVWGAGVIASTPGIWWQSFQAMTNVPYMIYFSLGVLYLSQTKINLADIALSSILTGISLFVRSEPFWILSLILLILRSISMRKHSYPLLWYIVVFSIGSVWTEIVPKLASVNTQLRTEVISLATSSTNIEGILFFKESVIYAWNYYNYLLPMLFIVILLFFQKTSKVEWIHASSVLSILMYIVSTAIYMNRHADWIDTTDSMVRMSIIIIPIIWSSIILSIPRLLTKQSL